MLLESTFWSMLMLSSLLHF